MPEVSVRASSACRRLAFAASLLNSVAPDEKKKPLAPRVLQQLKPAESKTKIYYDSNPKTKNLSLENETTEVFIPNG